MTAISNSNKYILLVLIFASILYSIHLFHDTLSPDEALYAWNSLKFVENPSLVFSDYLWKHQPPLMYVLIGALDIFMPNIVAARLLVYFFAVSGVYFIYLLGRELRDERLGLLAALFLAVNPWYWMMSNRVLADVIIAAFIILVSLFLLKYHRTKSPAYFTCAALFLALSLLTKYACVMFIPFFIIFAALAGKKQKNVLFVPLVFLVSGLAVIFYLMRRGDIVSQVFVKFSLSNIFTDFPRVARGMLTALFGYVPGSLYFVFYMLAALAACAAIYRVFRTGNRAGYLLLFLWIASVIIFRLIFRSLEPRYFLSAVPALILLIFYTLELERIPKAAVFAAFFIFLAAGNRISHMASYSKPGFKEAGLWLKENVNPEEKAVISAGSLRQIRYYSGFEYEKYGGIIFSDAIKDNYGTISPRQLKEEYSQHTVYLQIDFRDAFQRKWVFPPNLKKAKGLSRKSFKLAHVVYKEMPFYMMPPNKDRNKFLKYFGLKPYEIVSNGSNIYVPGIRKYAYNFDDGKYIESIGFKKARSIVDYFKFFFRKPAYLKQPVALILKRDS